MMDVEPCCKERGVSEVIGNSNAIGLCSGYLGVIIIVANPV